MLYIDKPDKGSELLTNVYEINLYAVTIDDTYCLVQVDTNDITKLLLGNINNYNQLQSLNNIL